MTVVRTELCPLCQEEGRDSDGDNLQIFDSGVMFCIASHGTIGKDQKLSKESNGVDKEVEQVADKKSKFQEGEYRDIKSRALLKKTCKFYGYMVNAEKQIHIANYCNAAGELAMQQVRTADKKFPIFGNKEFNDTLWGAHLFTPDERVFITITEGQIDTLSVAQAFDCKYPVVSLPNGVRSDNSGNNRAAEVLAKNKKYLDGFKYVILAFDNDGPGNAATSACLKILEPGKVRIARWPDKDANDMLKLGDEAGIRKVVYGAVEYIPAPILTGAQLMTSLEGAVAQTRPWPWKAANKAIRPIRIPSVISIAAKAGIGKTEFVSEMMKGVIGSGGRIGVIALEQTIQGVLVRLTDSLTGTTLTNITNRAFTDEEKESCRWVADQLVIYDHITYGSDIQAIVDNIAYMVKGLNCEMIVFDNLTYSATSIGGDERRGIDKAMVALKDSTVKYNYTLINVCHFKRDDETDLTICDGDCPVNIKNIRGSQGIELYSDLVIGLHRDKMSDNDKIKNTLQAWVLKDRNPPGSDEGKHWKMKYDRTTKRLGDCDELKKSNSRDEGEQVESNAIITHGNSI